MNSIIFRADDAQLWPKTMAYLLALTVVCCVSISAQAAASGAAEPERPPSQLSTEQAMRIALKKVPGEVTDAVVETKRGKKVYVIEVIAKKGGKETDVFVDMQTGEILGVD